MRVAVLIPLFNEQEHVIEVLAELRRSFQDQVVVVDDGSTDRSPSLLSQYAAHDARLQILRHRTRQGYGAALMEGFSWSIRHQYQYVVTMDCDRQHEPRLIPEFLCRAPEADIISGSRYLKDFDQNQEAPSDRRAINQRITAELNRLTGFGLSDAFCGFKSYRVAALQRLALDEPGYAFPVQLWIQAWRQRLTVQELAVPRLYPYLSRSFGDGLDDPQERLHHYLVALGREIPRTTQEASDG